MKSRILFSAVLAIAGLGAMAQLKIGYTNADYILTLMPEAKQIESDLSAYEKQLQNQLESKYKDYQAKVGDYQQNAVNYTDIVKADKENEIENLQESIQKFETEAQNSLVQKRNQLLTPAYEKIGTAIEQVAEENGYTHVFSSGSPGLNILLYAKEEYNISDLVFKKLGIDPPADN